MPVPAPRNNDEGVIRMVDPGMLFHLNLKDADPRQALEDFFQQAGYAFTLDDPLDGVISVRADDLNFHDALKLLLPTGFTAEEVHGIIHIRRIMPKEQAA